MRTGSNRGALGGPPDYIGTVGERALAPARYVVTCARKHKFALDCQKPWTFRSTPIRRLSPLDPQEYRQQWVEAGGVVTALPNAQGEYDALVVQSFACPTCGARPQKWAEVLGHWAADIPCNAKCTNATGANCDCSCGGTNHGSKALVWFQTHTVGKPSFGRAAVAVPVEVAKTRNPEPHAFVPPPAVADAARYGLELRASLPPSRRGGTAVGIRRAVQLANRQPVTIDTLKRMRSYFQRHAVDAKGTGWQVDSRGWQAWLLWGSYQGRDWCNRTLDRLGV